MSNVVNVELSVTSVRVGVGFLGTTKIYLHLNSLVLLLIFLGIK